MSLVGHTVFRGIYAFVIAFLAAVPLAKIVFFTTKPLAFLQDWQIVVFALEIVTAFLLTVGAAEEMQKRRVGFVGGCFVGVSVVTAVGFCLWHRHYLELPRVGSFDVLPIAFLAIPATAIVAALYARYTERIPNQPTEPLSPSVGSSS